ncbi:MAG: TonB-dependent receptor [Pseudomonadota bacterium]
MVRAGACAAGLVLACGGAIGQETVDEIVVTATRLEQTIERSPLAISVVEKAALDSGYQQVGIDEALTTVPGVFIQDRYNFAQDLRIAIRGFGARSSFGIRGIKLIVDDIPLTLPDGQGQLDTLDLASVERVEIVRGPAAALYGNAAGGLIRIASERPAPEPIVELGGGLGDDGFARIKARASGALGSNVLLVSASALDFDGYREHARTEQRLLNAVLRRPVGADGEFTLVANLADQPLAEDPGGVDAASAAATPTAARPQNVSFNAGESLEQARVGATLRHAVGDSMALRWRGYALDRNFDNRLPFTGGGQVDLDRRFVGGGVELRSTDAGALRWLAGFDVDDLRDDRSRFDNNDGVRGARTLAQREDVRAIGGFASLYWSAGGRWDLNVGGRYDVLRFRVTDRELADGDDSGLRRFRAFNPLVGATYRWRDDVVLFGNVARSFETPTTTEFANPAGGGFNPNLDPATALSTELGARWQLATTLKSTLSVYRIELDDELVPFELESAPGRDFFANAGESRRDGVELDVDWQPTEVLAVTLSVTANDFRFVTFNEANGNDFSGERTPGVPRYVAAIGARYDVSGSSFVALDVSRVGAISLNNAGSAEQSAYTVANARAGTTFSLDRSTVRVYLGVNNLTDEAYPANIRVNAFGARYFEPAPARYAYAGFDWRFRLGGANR